MATSSHDVIDFQNGYGDQNSYTSNRRSHSILDKLQKYSSVPEEVRNKADVIHNQMKVKQHRRTKLVQLLYWCCYCAYLELNLDVNPQELGKVFELTATEVSRCGSLFSSLETGYQPPKALTTPLNYLPGFCRARRLTDDATEQCLVLANRIISKQPNLLQEPPRNLAGGLLKYYLIINGLPTDDLRSVVGLSDNTVNPWYKVVENIDNNGASTATSSAPAPAPTPSLSTMEASSYLSNFVTIGPMLSQPMTPIFNFV